MVIVHSMVPPSLFTDICHNSHHFSLAPSHSRNFSGFPTSSISMPSLCPKSPTGKNQPRSLHRPLLFTMTVRYRSAERPLTWLRRRSFLVARLLEMCNRNERDYPCSFGLTRRDGNESMKINRGDRSRLLLYFGCYNCYAKRRGGKSWNEPYVHSGWQTILRTGD